MGWIDPLGMVCKERYARYKALREQGLGVNDAAKLSKSKRVDDPDRAVVPNSTRISSGAESSAQYAQLKDYYQSLDPDYTPLANKRILGDNHPINFELANSIDPKTGVRFTPDSYPDFEQHSILKVQINQTGNNQIDFKAANIEAGFGRGWTSHYNKVPGYTWHHHQNGIDMILVKTDPIHANTSHSGGAEIARRAGGAKQ